MIKKRNQESESAISSNLSQEIYSRLAKNRIIFLSEDITKSTGTNLSALLLFYNSESSKDEIKIYINSNGGDATALANIYDVMRMITAPICTICIGKAYSAAAILLAAGTPGKRFATKNCDIMIHGMQAQFPQTENADNLESEIELNMLLTHNDAIMNILANHTKKTFAQVSKDCERDLYMDAQEAFNYGMIDYIL